MSIRWITPRLGTGPALAVADRGYIIVHGEIVFDGRSVAELEQNELVKSYYLGA